MFHNDLCLDYDVSIINGVNTLKYKYIFFQLCSSVLNLIIIFDVKIKVAALPGFKLKQWCKIAQGNLKIKNNEIDERKNM